LIRHRIAVIGILALAAVTVFDFLLSVPALAFPDIEAFDKHVVEVLPVIPPSGAVGYWSDLDGNPNPNAQQTVLQEYYLTQYALVPRVVVKGLGQDVVITHAHSQDSRLPGTNLELARDFKDGIRVLRKKTK
jgi:hypothetical protein